MEDKEKVIQEIKDNQMEMMEYAKLKKINFLTCFDSGEDSFVVIREADDKSSYNYILSLSEQLHPALIPSLIVRMQERSGVFIEPVTEKPKPRRRFRFLWGLFEVS